LLSDTEEYNKTVARIPTPDFLIARDGREPPQRPMQEIRQVTDGLYYVASDDLTESEVQDFTTARRKTLENPWRSLLVRSHKAVNAMS